LDGVAAGLKGQIKFVSPFSQTSSSVSETASPMPRRSAAERFRGVGASSPRSYASQIHTLRKRTNTPVMQPAKRPSFKMMLYRATDEQGFNAESMEDWLESQFKVTFRYHHATGAFSIYGEESMVKLAVTKMKQEKIKFAKTYDNMYAINALELHLSLKDCNRLNQDDVVSKFMKDNRVTFRSEAMAKTKNNGSKQRKLLISGENWPAAVKLIAERMDKDLTKVYTNFIMISTSPKVDAKMNDRDPLTSRISRESCAAVRMMTKKLPRHILLSGKISDVIKAKEMMDQELKY